MEDPKKEWMDRNFPPVNIWIEWDGGLLAEEGTKREKYYLMDIGSHLGLIHATEELHKMFLHATEYVIKGTDDDYKQFHLPTSLFAKIKQSWETRGKQTIAGRFDFCLTSTGIKCYEYNADSASCLFEAGYMNTKWANAVGIGETTRDPNPHLYWILIAMWKNAKIKGKLHFLHDNDIEEKYHTVFMKTAAEEAGLCCKIFSSLDSFSWNDKGDVVDVDGEIVENVWKTYSWLTASDDLEAKKNRETKDTKPTLSDILFHSNIRVFEPLWTILTSSKAILPILWKLYPNHPLLLQTSFVLTEELKSKGYAAKPINGRAGGNIKLLDERGALIEKTEGKWESMDNVYQEMCLLPNYDGVKVQVNSWAIGGIYGGTVLREDTNNIVGVDSAVYCLRLENTPDQ